MMDIGDWQWKDNYEDNAMQLKMLTCRSTLTPEALDLLSKLLQTGTIHRLELMPTLVGDDPEKMQIYEFGVLCGTMDMSSTICYLRKKENIIRSKIEEGSKIPYFDDFMRYLSCCYRNCTIVDKDMIMSDLNLNEETVNNLINTARRGCLIRVRNIPAAKPVYFLSDDGIDYVKLLKDKD